MKLENRFTVPVPRADAWKVLMDVERIAPCMPGATLTSRDGDEFTGTVKVKVGPINLTYGGQAKFVSLDEAAGLAVIEGSGKETRGTGTAKALITCRLIDKGDSTDVEVETDLAVTGKPAQFGRGVLADVSAKLVDRFAVCLSEEIAAGDFDEDLSTPSSEAASGAPAAAAGGGLAAGTQPGSGPVASDTPDPHLPGLGGPPASTATDVATAALFETGPVGAAGGSGTPGGTAGAASAPAATSGGTAGAASGAGSTTSSGPRRPVREAEAIDLLDTAGMPILKRVAPGLAVLVVLIWLLRRLRS